MRIGIDGFSLARNDSGIEVYTRELVNGMLEFHTVELYSYAQIKIGPRPGLDVRTSGLTNASALQKLRWQLSGVTKLVSADVQVYHCPHFILPASSVNCKKVVTVHDLAFLRHPEFFDWKTKIYYRLLLKQSLESADAIICISKSCQDDLTEYFPSLCSKSVMIHNGFRDFSRIDPDVAIFSRLKLPRRFLLVIGTLNARKNIEGAIRAFEAVSEQQNLDLVVVGDLSRMRWDRTSRSRRIHFTGFISDAELSALYREALLLLFPSCYEGFGFPILEAMSVGLPVVTSNVSSMPEISGYPSDYLCDPGDTESISNLINRMLDEREALKVHGASVIGKFSWQKMVQLTQAVYAGI